ncbi:methyltransferase [Phaeovibrio sulfidiphilus]|uniref:Methyltransferase n=1 Tax=Phaeovibrio sulfidiphilus TaxID=1220600 RepID=A0A8J6YNN9_9PROT|nr:methyltransferase [Phaeovibrio sulfidiphilus]MBE1236701.1 methyltransferase [Phaeovibrio sulfidiphilus]
MTAFETAPLPTGPTPPEPREDALLGGRVRLLQPSAGYRAAIDPVFLAACVDARAGARILDAGAGTGAASLALAVRRPDLTVTGLERNAEALALFRESVIRTGCPERVIPVGADLGEAARTGPGDFDAVMTNPPYTESGSSTSPHPHRSEAHTESAAMPLDRWVRCCLALLRPKGRLYVVFPAARLDALVAACSRATGDLRVFPLWPRAGEPASRVLVCVRKGVRGPAQILPGLVLHEADGAYTAGANRILRDAGALDLRLSGRL